MPRMNILSVTEQDDFERPIILNTRQRKQFFETTPYVLENIHKLRSPANKIAFLLGYGYFKAGKRFFSPKYYHQNDIDYVSRKLGFSSDTFDPAAFPQRTAHYHQKLILASCGFKIWNSDAEDFINQEIRSMLLLNLKPKLKLNLNIKM